VIAIATTGDQIDRLTDALGALEAEIIDSISPGRSRLILLAQPRGVESSEKIAVALRGDGEMAVSRPDGGAALARWHENTRPVSFGDRLSICLAWSEHDRRNLGNLIELGPRGFGSGHHPTTRLLIEELVARTQPGATMLDVGCGSGVLALAAAKLGASRAVGVDLKAEALEATARNAALNGLRQVEVASTPIEAMEERFDIVVANIARSGIVALAPSLMARLAPRGWLAVSGITPAQCDLVAGYLHPLSVVARRIDGEWAMLVLGTGP
jgi:ribosomal protein L11 methyltransferase